MCNNTVIKAEQCCSTNNVVRYCFNNVVQHWWSKNSCSWLLGQEKTILIEQACSLLLSLFTRCSTIVHSWQHNIAVHTCWQLATGNNPVILTSAWIPCVTCPKISIPICKLSYIAKYEIYVDICRCLWEYNNDIYLVYILYYLKVYAAPKPKWTQLSNRRLQNWGRWRYCNVWVNFNCGSNIVTLYSWCHY